MVLTLLLIKEFVNEKKMESSKMLYDNLPDGVWFHIYSYLHRHRDPFLHYSRKVNVNSLDVGNLLKTMSSVSKEDNKRLFRYLSQVPQDFTYSYYDLETLVFACRNCMKLGGVVSFTSIGRIALNLYMYMIRSCNIRDMHTLTLNLQHYSSNVSRHFITSAIKVGIPVEVLKVSMSPLEFQQQYAAFIAEHSHIHSPSLNKLHLRVQKNEFYLPFLTMFSHSLEELSLHILKGGKSPNPGAYDHDLESFSNAIERMSKLKKLTICADLQASFRIRSASLEEINVMPTRFHFSVDECICPSLKVFKSRYHVWRDEEQVNGVKSIRSNGKQFFNLDFRSSDRRRPYIYGRMLS
jgi:hypothetical protein